MAAATSTSSVATSVASLPSSVSAFRTAGSPVQHVSVTSFRSMRGGRVFAARASLPSEEPQKFPIRRELLASILAAGVVLSSTGPVLADPLAEAKKSVDEAVSGIKESAGKATSSVPGPDDVKESTGKATSEAKGKIDGIFGKGKAAPFKFEGLNIGQAKEAVASKVDTAKDAATKVTPK